MGGNSDSSSDITDRERDLDLFLHYTDCWFFDSSLRKLLLKYDFNDFTEEESNMIDTFAEECKQK